jgi:hypothetical protein
MANNYCTLAYIQDVVASMWLDEAPLMPVETYAIVSEDQASRDVVALFIASVLVEPMCGIYGNSVLGDVLCAKAANTLVFDRDARYLLHREVWRAIWDNTEEMPAQTVQVLATVVWALGTMWGTNKPGQYLQTSVFQSLHEYAKLEVDKMLQYVLTGKYTAEDLRGRLQSTKISTTN